MRGRRKYQNPRPKKVEVDGVQYWRLQFRDIDGRSRTKSLGRAADLSYREADEKARDILEPINAANAQSIRKSQITIAQFVTRVFLPRQRKHWKDSTANTTTDEIERYLLEFPPDLPLGPRHLQGVTRTDLQSHIDALVTKGYGKTVTQHARWNLNAIFRLAKADGLMQINPAEDLAVGRDAIARTPKRGAAIGLEQFQQLVAALDLRDRLVVELVAIVGLRPGEAVALRWTDIDFTTESATVQQRVYRGKINTPKTTNSSRVAALPSGVFGRLQQWREMAEQPDGLVFPSENGKPLWVCNVLVRSLKPKARELGFGEMNFQVLRRFQTSEGRRAKIDDKVAADQRGHTVGVALATYTRTAVEQKRQAVQALESHLYAVPQALEARP
jgi:integrase